MKRIFFILSVWALFANAANAASACHKYAPESGSGDGLAALSQICVTNYDQGTTGNQTDPDQSTPEDCQHHFPSVAAYVPAAPQQVAQPQVRFEVPLPIQGLSAPLETAKNRRLPPRAPPISA